MKAYGSGCIDPHFLDLGTTWRRVVNFGPRPLYPRGKSPRYPLDRRLGGPQSRSGRFGEEKILDPIGTRTRTPRSSSPQLVAIPTTLSRLLYTVQQKQYISYLPDEYFKLNALTSHISIRTIVLNKFLCHDKHKCQRTLINGCNECVE
jgi:hypothetical protein